MLPTALFQIPHDTPWELAASAAGVAILMVVLFLRAIAQMRKEHVDEMRAQRVEHHKEMHAQRELFTTTLTHITAANAASAERVEVALRDLAIEMRSLMPSGRGPSQ